MKRCEHCNKKFTWGQIFQSFWLAYRPIHCKNCGTKHKITVPGRLLFVLLSVVPFVIFTNFIPLTTNLIVILCFASLSIAIGSSLAPFVVSYKKDESIGDK